MSHAIIHILLANVPQLLFSLRWLKMATVCRMKYLHKNKLTGQKHSLHELPLKGSIALLFGQKIDMDGE